MILAAVSGGLDSVAMAWRLLQGSTPVHIHHVSLRNGISNRTRRWIAEDAAMDRIVTWLRDQRFVFGHSTSTVLKDPRADIVIVTEECAGLVISGQVARPDAFVRGAAAHDFGVEAVGRRQVQALLAWKSILGPEAPPIDFPVRDMTRAEMWREMPEELSRLTWSCRRPRTTESGFVACHECKTCLQMIAEGIPLDRALSETAYA